MRTSVSVSVERCPHGCGRGNGCLFRFPDRSHSLLPVSLQSVCLGLGCIPSNHPFVDRDRRCGGIVVGFSRIAVAEDRQGRVWDVLKSKQFLWFFYAILFLNIAEASVKDLQMGNYYNAMAGFLLCVTIPYAPKFWTFTKDGNAELIAYTTAAWNFLYTTWNLAFVYAEDIGGPHWAGTICILLAAELYPLLVRRPELYIMARIYTLGAHLLIRACWDFFPQFTPISLYSAPVTHWWGIINFVLALPYVFWFTWQLNVGTAPITFRRGTARKDYLESHPEMAVRVAKDHVSAI